jgi:hypothetical protein
MILIARAARCSLRQTGHRDRRTFLRDLDPSPEESNRLAAGRLDFLNDLDPTSDEYDRLIPDPSKDLLGDPHLRYSRRHPDLSP